MQEMRIIISLHGAYDESRILDEFRRRIRKESTTLEKFFHSVAARPPPPGYQCKCKMSEHRRTEGYSISFLFLFHLFHVVCEPNAAAQHWFNINAIRLWLVRLLLPSILLYCKYTQNAISVRLCSFRQTQMQSKTIWNDIFDSIQ